MRDWLLEQMNDRNSLLSCTLRGLPSMMLTLGILVILILLAVFWPTGFVIVLGLFLVIMFSALIGAEM